MLYFEYITIFDSTCTMLYFDDIAVPSLIPHVLCYTLMILQYHLRPCTCYTLIPIFDSTCTMLYFDDIALPSSIPPMLYFDDIAVPSLIPHVLCYTLMILQYHLRFHMYYVIL